MLKSLRFVVCACLGGLVGFVAAVSSVHALTQAESKKSAAGTARADALDRTVLPIAEPKRETITEIDARKAKAPPRFEFDYDGGLGKSGTLTINVDQKPVAKGRIERTIPFRVALDETLDFGEDTGTPVSEDYHVPFKSTGKLNRVLIRLGDEKLSAEDEEQIRRAKAALNVSQLSKVGWASPTRQLGTQNGDDSNANARRRLIHSLWWAVPTLLAGAASRDPHTPQVGSVRSMPEIPWILRPVPITGRRHRLVDDKPNGH